jgi:hypothetical protein
MNKKITLIHEGKELLIVCDDKTIERIIDAIYPNKGIQDASKGYIQLVDFFYK